MFYLISERDAIQMTLTFTSLLEKNANFDITSPTEKLMYLMICFMGPDSQFLEPEIKKLLLEHISIFYQKCRELRTMFEFDFIFEGKIHF